MLFERASWTDPGGNATIEDVQDKTFTAFQGPLAKGYTSAAIWIRIRVAPSVHSKPILTVQPTFLDHISLYSRGRNNEWQVQRAGDLVEERFRSRADLNNAFEVTASTDVSTTHYLRIQTTSANFSNLRLLSPADNDKFNAAYAGAAGFYSGIVLLLCAIAAGGAWLTRDRLWLLNCLLQLTTLILTFFLLGFASHYLFRQHAAFADTGVSVLACLHVFMFSLFFWQMFKAYKAPGWTTLPYRLSMLVFPLCMVLIACGAPQAAVHINSQLVLLLALAGFVIIWFVPVEDARLRWMLRATFVILATYILLFILPLLGLLPMTEFNIYPALGSNLLAGLMQFALLLRRTQLQTRERWTLQHRMRHTDILLEREREHSEEAERFLGMLMHEIRTPLAAIKVSADTLRERGSTDEDYLGSRLKSIARSVEEIDAVLEQSVAADRLDQGATEVELAPADVVDILRSSCDEIDPERRIDWVAPERLEAQVEKVLLPLMLRNLLANALNYSPPGSRIDVVLRSARRGEQDGYSIAVTNQVGRAGYPDPDQLFRKYYRAPAAHHVTGTGLGLYWVQGVAKLLGGEIRYSPETQNSVVFTLWFPNSL